MSANTQNRISKIRWAAPVGLLCLSVLAQQAFCAEGSGGELPYPPGSGSPQSCGSNWEAYGFAVPGDPQYGFGLPDNNTKDLVGFAAKGNIVIGDYTHPDFKTDVLPKLRSPSFTKPYVVDGSDADLGYDNTGPDICGGYSPCFDGNYDQVDGGTKSNGTTARKFYESGLTDEELHAKQLIQEAPDGDDNISQTNNGSYSDTFEGVFYTNHAIAGKVGAQYMDIHGALLARDEALIYNTKFRVVHDVRLLSPESQVLILPFEIKRPQLTRWEECPPSGCADP